VVGIEEKVGRNRKMPTETTTPPGMGFEPTDSVH